MRYFFHYTIMMNALIAYATYSSGTETVSEVIEEVLAKAGYEVVRENIKKLEPAILKSFDLVLFGSPSWLNNHKDGQPHTFTLEFIQKAKGKTFPQKKFAIFGLGDTAYPNFCGAVTVLEQFVEKLQGKLLLPSLRIDGFYFNEEEHKKHVRSWAETIAKTALH